MLKLLSQNDKVVCENIVKIGNAIDIKRAKALLLIDEGNTQAKAAEESTLSIGQVKYTLAKYRATGLAFFPTELTVLKEDNKPIEENKIEIKKDIAIIDAIEETTSLNDTKDINKEKLGEETKPKTVIKPKKKKEKIKKKSKKTDSQKVKKIKKISKKKDIKNKKIKPKKIKSKKIKSKKSSKISKNKKSKKNKK